jgi:NADPH-dependent 2,4-dienoyl-CoA reductase/sulfur reductase-like enzyme
LKPVAEVFEAEIAVVGAGPAGVAAATRAARLGASVVVLDEGFSPGGQIWKGRRNGRLRRFAGSGARVVTGVSVVAAEAGFLLAERIDTPGQTVEVRAPVLVVATGARERYLPFPGWTLPNIMGIGGIQSMLKSGASFRGKRVVVAGSGPLLLPAAASLAASGARVEVVAEQAPPEAVRRFALGLLRHPGKLAQAIALRARFLRTAYRPGTWVTQARGDDRVREVELTDGTRSWTATCDILATGYGLVPNTELASLLGCDVVAGRVVVDDRQRTSIPEVFCAGEPTGIAGVEAALVEGEIAGASAAGRPELARSLALRRVRLAAWGESIERAFELRPELRSLARPETIVCRCEDVPLSRLDPSRGVREGKLYARAGMGPCQGRVCGPALEFLFGWQSDSVRPPLRPATMGALAQGGDSK